jgi:hypothetical protein
MDTRTTTTAAGHKTMGQKVKEHIPGTAENKLHKAEKATGTATTGVPHTGHTGVGTTGGVGTGMGTGAHHGLGGEQHTYDRDYNHETVDEHIREKNPAGHTHPSAGMNREGYTGTGI